MGQGSSTNQRDPGEFSIFISTVGRRLAAPARHACGYLIRGGHMLIELCLFFVSVMLFIRTPQIDLADGGTF